MNPRHFKAKQPLARYGATEGRTRSRLPSASYTITRDVTSPPKLSNNDGGGN